MLRGLPWPRKPRHTLFSMQSWVLPQLSRPCVTVVTLGAEARPGVTASVRQRKMNCICVPASSMTSPLRRGIESLVSGMPLTLGRELPSTCAKA